MTAMLAKKLTWLFLAIVGAATFVVALDYPFGTLSAIGPAVYPLILSSIIALVSIYSIFFEARKEPEPLDRRALACVVSAVIIFILLVENIVWCLRCFVYGGGLCRAEPSRISGFLVFACLFAVGSFAVLPMR
jgi:hypothetical protein